MGAGRSSSADQLGSLSATRGDVDDLPPEFLQPRTDDDNDDAMFNLDLGDLTPSRDLVLSDVAACGLDLQFQSEDHRNDREIVLAAVKEVGVALKFASEELRSDREIVMIAVSQASEEMGRRLSESEIDHTISQDDRLILQFASEELRGDREVVLKAVEQQPDSLQFASDALRGDREVVLKAVEQQPDSLQFASDALKSDREVVMVACRKHGRAIMFAARNVHADREVMLVAASSWARTVQYASAELRDDKEFALCVLNSGNGLPPNLDMVAFSFCIAFTRRGGLEVLSERLCADAEVVKAAVCKDGSQLQFAHPSRQADRDIVIMAVGQHGSALAHASEALQADLEVVMLALPTFGCALQWASPELQADEEVARQAVFYSKEALMYAEADVADRLVSDPEIYQRLMRETVENSSDVVFKITMLSGRHCYFVSSHHATSREHLLRHCARQLQLPAEELEGARLLWAETGEPVQDEAQTSQRPICDWPDIQKGSVNSLQLVLAKRRRLE